MTTAAAQTVVAAAATATRWSCPSLYCNGPHPMASLSTTSPPTDAPSAANSTDGLGRVGGGGERPLVDNRGSARVAGGGEESALKRAIGGVRVGEGGGFLSHG